MRENWFIDFTSDYIIDFLDIDDGSIEEQVRELVKHEELSQKVLEATLDKVAVLEVA
jgi:hypothetical protein